ncbi:MAG TPA: hypothetical protein VIL85_20210 [Thermomicrobiales bacterium]|jgi:hypothetical protein
MMAAQSWSREQGFARWQENSVGQDLNPGVAAEDQEMLIGGAEKSRTTTDHARDKVVSSRMIRMPVANK